MTKPCLHCAYILAVFFSLCTLGSCEKKNRSTIQYDIIIEAHLEGSSVLLECETNGLYPEIPNLLHHTITWRGGIIQIWFTEVEEIGGWFALGPANTSIDLGDLKNGQYTLHFLLNDQSNLAILTVSTEAALEFTESVNVGTKDNLL